jgi:uncharacterized protein YjgD (DUF1641 family)
MDQDLRQFFSGSNGEPHVGEEENVLIDNQPFAIALHNAADIGWSGILRALKDSEQIGVVVMRDGHVAWAVSNNQTENFGSFLERIGMVPKDKLNEVIQKYKTLGKSKKLGALLEEAGLISNSALRECLRAHVRAAIVSMLDDQGIMIQAKDGEMAVDANLIFKLDEVLADSGEAEVMSCFPVPGPVDAGRLEELIRDLASLSGYRYALVANVDGGLVARHVPDGSGLDVDPSVPKIVSWFLAAMETSVEMGMGIVDSAILQSESGLLVVQAVDGTGRFLVAVSCTADGKLGVIKHKIAELTPEIGRLVEGR